MQEKLKLIEQEIQRVWHVNLGPSKELNEYLEKSGTEPLSSGIKLAQLIRRPQLSYEGLRFVDPQRPELLEQVEAMRKLEKKALPADLDYSQINGLRLEAIEKLNKIKPLSVGQASRISGVNPADINVLQIYLTQLK